MRHKTVKNEKTNRKHAKPKVGKIKGTKENKICSINMTNEQENKTYCRGKNNKETTYRTIKQAIAR